MINKNATQKRKLRELLRELRENAGLRQTDLANRLNRPQSFVSKFESGEKSLSFLETVEVCHALSIPLADFVSRFEQESDES